MNSKKSIIIGIIVLSLLPIEVFGQKTNTTKNTIDNTLTNTSNTPTNNAQSNDASTNSTPAKERQQNNKKRNTRKKYVFEISKSYVSFGAGRGSTNLSVNANQSWKIKYNSNSWIHLSQGNNYLTINVDENPYAKQRTGSITLASGKKDITVTITQNGETKFSISSNKESFYATGGSKTFRVTANADWRVKTNPASWGHLTRNGNDLTLKVDENTASTARNDYFELVSGNRTLRVDISQSAGEQMLGVSSQSLSFTSLGGTQTISVQTNGSWDVAVSTASWGHLTRNGNQLTVRVDANYSSAQRTDYFEIKAGNKRQRINISQYGNYNSSNDNGDSFNEAQDEYFGGLSVGYIQKQWTKEIDGSKEKMGMFDDDKYLQGIQAGIRIDPQFGWGFGMNTGIFYEYCWAKSESVFDMYGDYRFKYNEHSLYAPLDLKYTMNFSEYFQLSFYGGVGFNYVLSGKVTVTDSDDYEEDMFSDHDNMKRFNMMLEYGASLRISAVQFDFTMAQGLTNWSDESGMTLKQGRPMSISATICF